MLESTITKPATLPKSPASALADRDVVFVSHANPEDNAFATWLTLRLTREGYRVWCDVVRLRGGDDFWKDIEEAIRRRTRKFIFVTSRSSNSKQGTLQELAVAAAVGRETSDAGFIIPVKIDDLPHREHNIQIHRLNAVSFSDGWEDGLAVLLKTLKDGSVPQPISTGPSNVASWWNSHRLNHALLKNTPELLWTNWFPLKGIPRALWVWNLPEDGLLPAKFPYPVYRSGKRLFSFADAKMLTGSEAAPAGGTGFSLTFNLTRDPPRKFGLTRYEVTTAVKQLLRISWEMTIEQRGLPFFELSNRRRSLWFPHGSVPEATAKFIGVDGKQQHRDLYGFKTIKRATGESHLRYWHFGLEALPILYPSPVLALKSHVVFTLDGKNVAGDAKVQHRARRSQCRSWWNDKWRDLMLAAVAQLSNGLPSIPLVATTDSQLTLDSRPITYQSSVSYEDQDLQPPTDAENTDEFEDDDEQVEEIE